MSDIESAISRFDRWSPLLPVKLRGRAHQSRFD